MTARTRWHAWVVIGCVLLGSSCNGIARPEEHKRFLQLSMAEQRTSILQYPLAQQVELYVVAMLAEHPPDLALADVVASNGSKIIPALTQRLTQEESDIAKMHLVDVFWRMQDLGYYPVVSDDKTMDFLDQQVAAMKDPQWKDMSSDFLERIRQGNKDSQGK